MLKIINELCKAKGTNIATIEKELGFSKASIGKWDTNAPSVKKVQAVADYLGVSVDYILGHETESQKITDEELKFALFGGEKGITEEDLAEVKSFAEFVKNKRKK